MSVIPAAPPTEIIASNTSSHAPTTLSAQNSHLFQHASGFDIVGGQFVLGDVHNHHPNPASGVAVSLPLLNLVDEDFSESEIYCNQLLRRKRGFPLHDPAPPQNLPAEYRKKGVAIGDVGRVTSEGCFDFGFNIYLPAEHPINNNDVPENFCPLTSYAPRDLFCKDYTPGNHLSTDSIQKVDFHHDFPGGDFVFRCIAPQGAVLALPHGAHSEKLKNLELLRAYAATHAESWYRYMNITRGRGLENGLLYLVTGCEKVQSWGMASFRGVRDEFQLAFKPTPRANSPSQYRWSGLYGHQNPAQSNSYDASSTDNAPWNQTTFIHGLSISLGAGIWGKLFGKVEIREIGDSALRSAKGNDSVSTTSSHSQFSWLFDFIGGGPGAGRNYCADQDVQVRLSNISPNSKIFNPGQLINSYILHEAPQATVVLSHDDDWRDILADSGNSSAEFTIQDVSEFLQQIRVEFDIIETHGWWKDIYSHPFTYTNIQAQLFCNHVQRANLYAPRKLVYNSLRRP
ncbi:hypothetical protein C8F04DRAFT_678477 [Mycena alexandri]|uniref:Uncharacterized protein n=1 Tax=Mycena alexandri TaxID=1745969 RepID=A0AAD6TH35_9AGAR|nr:hypothetical protein C8F04DRAFT_678477 [Mycena alexandri]